MSANNDEASESRANLSAAFTGLGVALVWLAIVTAICYYLAVNAKG